MEEETGLSWCEACGHDDQVRRSSFEGRLASLLRQRPRCREWVPDRGGWPHPCSCADPFHDG